MSSAASVASMKMVIMKKWEALQQEAKHIYEKAKLDLKELVERDASAADGFADKVYAKMIDDILLETVAEYHRAAVRGYADHLFPSAGGLVDKKIKDINCPNCGQLTSPYRFPTHLQTCMKVGGRPRTRLATGRGQTTSLKEASDPCPSTGTSDDGDDDWMTPFDKPSASHPKKKKLAQKNKNHNKKVRFII